MPDDGLRYIIDASALIDMKLLYARDVLPTMWEKLGELADGGTMMAPELVLRELERQEDEVYEWARNHDYMFISTGTPVQEKARDILEDHSSLVDVRQRFCADPFVIAEALLHSCVVVTHEKPTGNSAKEHIPDVCRQVGLEHIVVLEMFRRERLQL